MNTLTPREIVSELDKYIVGQNAAKRMVAIAMRNRWRRQQIEPVLRDEIAPKNILMIGPTGVGKTEIARRLAKLAGCPFHKVEATKFTEIGYVGRDVESMVRDLMEIGVQLIRQEEAGKVRVMAEKAAEERLLDLLLPATKQAPPSYYAGSQSAIPLGASEETQSTREKLRQLWRKGALDDKQVEMEVTVASPSVEIMAMPGMEELGSQFKDMFSKAFPQKKKTRKLKVREAYDILITEESEKLVDMDKVAETARERVEQTGILFIDEIDKICGRSSQGGSGPDVSREGVQRDLLPVVEGCVVNTKYGMVRTDHIPVHLRRGLPLLQALGPGARAAGPLPAAGGALGPGQGRIPAHPHRAPELSDHPVHSLAGHRGRHPGVPPGGPGRGGGLCPEGERRDREHRGAQALHHHGKDRAGPVVRGPGPGRRDGCHR